MMMAFGGMLGLVGLPLPGVELGISASAIVLGVMVLGQVRPPLVLSVLIVAFFSVFHGHAHGTELKAGQNAMLYSLGFVVATGLLHAAGIEDAPGSVKPSASANAVMVEAVPMVIQ